MTDQHIEQNIILEGRKRISVNGVTDVESFDEDTVNLTTELGILNIKGYDIKIEKLNLETGEISATGDFYLMEYITDEKQPKGLFSRIFK